MYISLGAFRSWTTGLITTPIASGTGLTARSFEAPSRHPQVITSSAGTVESEPGAHQRHLQIVNKLLLFRRSSLSIDFPSWIMDGK